MSIPLPETDNSQLRLAGDYKDDDPQVIDALVNPEANPPAPDELPTVKPPVTEEPKPINRLLTRTEILQPGWPPQLMMPADPFRESLTIRVSAQNATDFLAIADDAGKLQTEAGSFVIFDASTWSDTYTGPLWVKAFAADGSAATGTVMVSVSAVTK